MTIALKFPGQGSQAVGMGQALADSYPQDKVVFEELDKVPDEKLLKIIWNDPEETLALNR